ncbi:hypothetical protein ABZ791_13260 [Streptomyces huasconensis]|uniref:Aromatic ring-opening dioxygenase LigA n=1 Tax=Streptomyces huasconensis TaxID=1854574 RepID=A0ABV3LQT3_9ACTN
MRWDGQSGQDRAGTRLPDGMTPPRRPRRLPRLPPASPGRHRLNKLFYVAAVLGIGTSLWAYWLTYTDLRDRAASEERIAEACGGVIDAEAVMELRGGFGRAVAWGEDGGAPRPGATPRECRVGWDRGRNGHQGSFSLLIRTPEDPMPMHLVGDSVRLEPFGHRGTLASRPADVTRRADHAEPRPLGDGALGHYTDDAVTVRADCAAGKPSALQVTAKAGYDDVSDADREILAGLARDSLTRAAARLDCRMPRLPEVPDELRGPGRRLSAPETARASCAWYARHLGDTRRGRLPDRLLETPTGAESTTETCLLAVSPRGVRATTPHLSDSQRRLTDSALTHSPWWMRTASFFGTEARSVAVHDYDEPHPARPGTAGGGEGLGAWWASSVCDGRPAVHTLTVSYTYDNLTRDRLRALFRAYVDDITARRGCTDVTFPAPAAFR